MTLKKTMEYTTWFGTAALCVLMIWMYSQGYFKDPSALQSILSSAGAFGVLFFIFIQAFQVVVPIIPGGFTCALGVLCFGPLYGLIYNYIGLVAGSLIIFYLSRTYGQSFVKKMLKEETYNKYIGYLNNGKKFTWFFAAAIFAPFAPDDALCLIAGLSNMSWPVYSAIILAGKPLALIGYSLSLTTVLSWL